METYMLAALILILSTAVVCDISRARIPNLITLPAMAAAALMHSATTGAEGFFYSMKGIGLGIAVLIVPYLLGGMGAGDAKLMGAVGAFLGPAGVFSAFLYTALAGGIYALIVIIKSGNLTVTWRRYWLMLKNLMTTHQLHYIPPTVQEKRPRLRYGIAIAVGTMFSVLWGEAFVAGRIGVFSI